jgi:hypothetical protein
VGSKEQSATKHRVSFWKNCLFSNAARTRSFTQSVPCPVWDGKSRTSLGVS